LFQNKFLDKSLAVLGHILKNNIEKVQVRKGRIREIPKDQRSQYFCGAKWHFYATKSLREKTRGLVSKEAVVLHRWGRETKFWIYQLS